MQLNEVTFEEQPPVDGYGPGFFRVQNQVFNGSIFLNADGVKIWDGYGDVSVILNAKASYDIVFVGTGADIAPLPKDIKQTFDAAEIPAEVMSSSSACRTYNILLSEGRRVALAVLTV